MFDLSVIGVALRWWMIGSYRMGEFIVYTGITFVEILVDAVKSFNSICHLMYEGSSLWLADIYDCFCGIEELTRYTSDYLSGIASAVTTAVGNALCAPFSLFFILVAELRQLLLLLGSSCLFLISLPPLFMIYFIDALLHAFKAFSFFVRYTTERLTEHAGDIQTLEVLLGFVVGCGLIVIAVNGSRIMVQWYFKFKSKAGRGLKTWAGRAWRKARRRVTTVRREKDVCKLQETELCIVCFEKARSVCLLPCRHLSLCTSCTQSISYPLRCPLCRQLAEDFIHVYL